MDYTYLDKRIDSFENFIPMVSRSEAVSLAKSGLYALNRMIMRCISCGSIMDTTSMGANMYKDHVILSDNRCIFMKMLLPNSVRNAYEYEIHHTVPKIFGNFRSIYTEKRRRIRDLNRITERQNDVIRKECPVCMEEDIAILILPCRHTFCPTCSYMFNRCPMCRGDIVKKEREMY